MKKKKCKVCGEGFVPKYNLLQPCCSYKCTNIFNSKKESKNYGTIKKVSDKRAAETKIYKQRRLLFLSLPENKICFIEGCNKKADTIEHRRGRKGYADEEARLNGVTLYIDERFWAGCCNAHNLELENNPELSKKYQLSKIHGGKK